MNDQITQAKASLVTALNGEIASLKKRIEEGQTHLDELYELLGGLLRQVHQITEREMEAHLGPAHLRSQAAWRARNIALCRLFLTTNMTRRDIAKQFGLSGTMVGLIFLHYGIPSDKSFTSERSRKQRERYWFGDRKEQLPPDLQAMIEEMKAAP